jgi:hypothetical protein
VTNLLAQLIAWLNVPANAAGSWLLAPIARVPGWVSSTIAAAVLGAVTLLAFKYTSHQRVIGWVRDDIKAHLLAVKLFPDDLWVTFRAEGRVLRGAAALALLAVVPMLAMIVPVALVLGQLGLWYQARPLSVGEEAVVTMKLGGNGSDAWPSVALSLPDAAELVLGPVRMLDERAICWDIKARQEGCHLLRFQVGGQTVAKQLAIGRGFMRTSEERPGWQWTDILLQPAEPPFRPGDAVRSIRIDYPSRDSWTSGTDWWIAYCLLASMLFAWCLRPWFKVTL